MRLNVSYATRWEFSFALMWRQHIDDGRSVYALGSNDVIGLYGMSSVRHQASWKLMLIC